MTEEPEKTIGRY